MTVELAGRPTRVWLRCGGTADGLGATVRSAVELLAGVGALQLVGPGEAADLVHTVGAVPDPAPGGLRLVHSVDRVPLRRRGLAPSRWWLRQERRHAADSAAWLAHGRTTARILVDAGLIAAERMHCLPVLPPPMAEAPTAGTSSREPRTRAALRRELGVPPGVGLVVGARPEATGIGDWAAAIERLHRTDVRVLRYRTASGRLGPAERRRQLGDLLCAADLFVAAGNELAACNAGAAAIELGVPVVAVSTDSAAELVDTGRTGFVVPPQPDAVAGAVRAYLDGGLRRRRTFDAVLDDRRVLERLARTLAQVYGDALAAPVPRGGWSRW